MPMRPLAQMELNFSASSTSKTDGSTVTSADLSPAVADAKTKSQPPLTGEPLAVRMINEYVYCPRLFYYESVEGLFLHNADTLAGQEAHRRIDTKQPGALDSAKARRKKKDTNLHQPDDPAGNNKADASAPGENTSVSPVEPETIHARSISLYSSRLHLTGKLDLVEGEAAAPGESLRYTPVEYKKGRPREGDDGRELWDADRVQLTLQMMLLRENGFPSETGIVFYRETRQRVTFQPTEEDTAWARRMVEEARQVQQGPLPPPLEHSPKCPRCSLVSICLPDETRLLADEATPLPFREPQLELPFAQRDHGPPRTALNSLLDSIQRVPTPPLRRVKVDPDLRRLIAPNPETRALYLNTPGSWVGKRGETLTIKEKDALLDEFRLIDLHHVALFGPVQVSTAVVQTLCDAEIPLTYFTTNGWFYGLTRGHTLKNVLTRIQQFRVAADPTAALALARQMIYGKIANQRTLLMRNHLDPPKDVLKALKHLAHAALLATNLPQLLGLEGTAASLYFGAFGGMIKPRATAASDDATLEASDAPAKDAPLTEHRWPAAANSPASARFPFYPNARNRRPPRDPVNALLSLTYSLLVKECTLACYIVGLDPYVGFMHQPRHGRPALALDLMEEFRPLLADSTVLTLLNNGMLTEKDFVLSSHACGLTAAGRKTVFLAWERRLHDGITHPLFNYKVSYRRAVELQARLLAKFLTGEIPEYLPFTTR